MWCKSKIFIATTTIWLLAFSLMPSETVAQKNGGILHGTIEQIETTKREAKRLSVKRSEVPIENREALYRFAENLYNASSINRPIRVAVLGDSFIEGDIFTQDLRELFQLKYGGRGVGFVPMASEIAGFRSSVKHSFYGWNTHCATTASRRRDYTISLNTFTTDSNATSRYRGSTTHKKNNNFASAQLLFMSKGESKIRTQINRESKEEYTINPSDKLQLLTLSCDTITSVEFSVVSPRGFTAYGVYLDDFSGVCVDNYSTRGNSGIPLRSTNAELIAQMNELLPIDLIILEYGLNSTDTNTTSYTYYIEQMELVIEHLKEALPNCAILVMSVSDRVYRGANGWQTMPGIISMSKAQRELARKCNVGFWNTLEAMQLRGGIREFARKGWAAQDYTHLSSRGGQVIAEMFFDSIRELCDEFESLYY